VREVLFRVPPFSQTVLVQLNFSVYSDVSAVCGDAVGSRKIMAQIPLGFFYPLIRISMRFFLPLGVRSALNVLDCGPPPLFPDLRVKVSWLEFFFGNAIFPFPLDDGFVRRLYFRLVSFGPALCVLSGKAFLVVLPPPPFFPSPLILALP